MELGELPAGWALEKLERLATKITKGATPTTYGYEFQRSGVNFIKIQNVSHGEIDTSSIVDFISEDAHQFQKKSILKVDDVIFSIAGTIGETAILKECHLPANTNQAFAIISGFSDFLVPKYLEFQLRSFVAQKTKEKARGGAMNNVSLDDLKNLEVLLPPLGEQHRIVAKIEELFSELDQGVASLKTAREQIKVYRQSLLKNAFAGKLTVAWRAAHADQLETATALQQRIARERQARYQQQLADWQTAGQAGPKPKPPKSLPPLTAEELAALPELPAGWCWGRLSEIATVLSGYAFKSTAFTISGVPVIKIANVGYSRFVVKDQEYLPASFLSEFDQFVINPGDLLVALTRPITNDLTKVCRYPAGSNSALLNQRVAALKSILADADFLFAFLGTPIFKEFIRSKFSETLQPNLSPKDLENTPFPICCPLEQAAIVQELESKLSEADQLDQTLATALQQADALRQAILKKAFHGQLVPQDKNEEPAAALLERIRAARGTEKPARRGRSASSQL